MEMVRINVLLLVTLLFLSTTACKRAESSPGINIVFLHHSTGWAIWKGNSPTFLEKVARRISNDLAERLGSKAILPSLFEEYNAEHNSHYSIEELAFPKAEPYGWNNNPYDYYNIWVKNAGENPYLEEPTLEMLTKEFQVIIFKHCYPVSNIKPDSIPSGSDQRIKTITNYKSHYLALRDKMHQFPDTKFILFTGAVQVRINITEDEALRTKEFFTWVNNEWDLPDDNIYLWDLYNLQTEGGLYFKDQFAVGPGNSHPNEEFSKRASNLLFQRIIDVIINEGTKTSLTGEPI